MRVGLTDEDVALIIVVQPKLPTDGNVLCSSSHSPKACFWYNNGTICRYLMVCAVTLLQQVSVSSQTFSPACHCLPKLTIYFSFGSGESSRCEAHGAYVMCEPRR